MTKNELNIHLEYARKMQQDIRDLEDTLISDRSDDGWAIKDSYSKILREIRILLAREYDAEK
jgi:hypothetical protein